MSRKPSERDAVAAALQKSKKPITPSEIQKLVHGRMHISTVYRALKALTQIGVVRRVDLGTRSSQFEYVNEQEHHHHLVCVRCGTVQDVSVCLPQKTLSSVLHNTQFAEVVEHRLEFSGICKSCA